ncbi:dihydrofolate reductase [Pyricularia oryzae 70-15]|uniref:Dihydrofolate reductase n=2 Tax=Pyricularia oryzae TaxID=318829 RepID=G4MUQ5_PYRO7|nr:dihydrofolate reductase [Pyricularia oryzae 70-15]KAI6265436.1 hypothetical protein MCOR26_010743 [Pyricularia oryzae]EHA54028.1 dihydrofolate reductase [Pyricularia oryzae 70-15]KAI6321449.1 hypothetical protein MCOR29_004991 [Pyricularia oryzae]KAI6368399.1 hypothetical protein MCOR32_006918 [Pyricularia oryzae]KAI6391088.1 hypothetical protein MCOR23_009179 [Pyricularia oryzae]
MPPTSPIELTLVLAATRDMGIGRGGTLPWTGLKKEMAYFARVTKRLPAADDKPPTALNAVIMGRKTWDSIPPKFRPLKGRLNVVLSRSFPELKGTPPPPSSAAATTTTTTTTDPDPVVNDRVPIHARSLPEALAYLGQLREQRQAVGKVFIIGGAQIYDVALGLPETRRVLFTSVMSDFECDASVALRLGEGTGWRRTSKEEHDAWVGEEVPAGVQEENGTQYEFQMWERSD